MLIRLRVYYTRQLQQQKQQQQKKKKKKRIRYSLQNYYQLRVVDKIFIFERNLL